MLKLILRVQQGRCFPINKFYIVDRSLLPQTYDKVIEARHLLSTGEVKKISDAVKRVGISRGSYYKYKNLIYETDQNRWNQKAVISFMLKNERGMLSTALKVLADQNASILTINQNIPIHNIATVVISLDLSNLKGDINGLLANLSNTEGVNKVELLSIE